MAKSFSLAFGPNLLTDPTLPDGREEYFFEYLSEFDPFEGLSPRVVSQKMLEGQNFQDSGLFYSDGRIQVAGRLMRLEEFDRLWDKYAAPVASRGPFVFVSYLRCSDAKELALAEFWKVIFREFKPKPERIISKTDFRWSLDLFVLAKWEGGAWRK